MKTIIYTLLFILSLSIIPQTYADSLVACTMDARMCPDGSYVGRTEPNCEFAPCQTQATTTTNMCQNLSTHIVRFGQRSEDIKNLQTYLYAKYNPQGKPTGYFGTLTRSYVVRFQKEHHITPTGIVGPLTRKALGEDCDGTTPPPISGTSQPSATCKVWFDGCNTCSRTSPGGPMMCTMMACIWANQGAATCKESF